MKNTFIVIIVIAVIAIGTYFIGQSSSNPTQSTNTAQSTIQTTEETNSSPQSRAITPTVSAETMQNSCQEVADSQLRNGLFESTAANYTSGNTKPSVVKDLAHYNQNKSVCAFVTLVVNYPNAYEVTNPYRNVGVNLYSVALMPDGSIETPNNNNAVQTVAYSYTQSYTYPKPVDETKYTDFNLKQIGIGTSNYSIQTLGVGNSITSSQFSSLVYDYMETDLNTLMNQM